MHIFRLRRRTKAKNNIEMLYILGFQPASKTGRFVITNRGKEIFSLIVEGKSCPEIGAQLGISVTRVKQHRGKMLIANECKTMDELIAKYYSIAGNS